jgi:hypothetical protein
LRLFHTVSEEAFYEVRYPLDFVTAVVKEGR